MSEFPSVVDETERRRLYEAAMRGEDEPIKLPKRRGRTLCEHCGQGFMVRQNGRAVYCYACGKTPIGDVIA